MTARASGSTPSGQPARPKHHAGNVACSQARQLFHRSLRDAGQDRCRGSLFLNGILWTIDSVYGPAGMADEIFVHDIAATFDITDSYRIYGGVNNVGDERPFITEFAFPVNPIGRFFFPGLDANFM